MSAKRAIKAFICKIPCGEKVLSQVIAGKQKREMKKRIAVIQEKGNSSVREMESALAESGITYFATCGTLLGLIRENRLLRNDYDMDYAILVENPDSWIRLEKAMKGIGYGLIRRFTLDGRVTEHTYRSKDGIEIDFFGHFIEDGELSFYSYDKLSDVAYPSQDHWSAYVLRNGAFAGVKRIETQIGTVTVPANAEEYLTYNYNDDWRIPDPNFKANTGKGCSLLGGKYGIMELL